MGSIIIADEIFEKFPSFRRGIVIARNMKNKAEDNELYEMLKKTLSDRFENPVDLESDSRITDWKDAHRLSVQTPTNSLPPILHLLKEFRRKKLKSLLSTALSLL